MIEKTDARAFRMPPFHAIVTVAPLASPHAGNEVKTDDPTTPVPPERGPLPTCRI
jgi:hypothetical protein